MRAFLLPLTFVLVGGSALAGEPARAPDPKPAREPARLAVEAPDEAGVHLDGELVAITPLDEPLAIEPGRHFVAITADGHEPRAETIVVGAGETTTVVADLAVTDQRVGAGILLGVGAGGLATGLVLGVLSVVEHRAAQDLFDDVGPTGPSPATRAVYDEAIARRDDFRLGSGIAAGVGLGLFVVGGALFVLDHPDPPAPPGAASRRPIVTPLIAPGLAGGALRIAF